MIAEVSFVSCVLCNKYMHLTQQADSKCFSNLRCKRNGKAYPAWHDVQFIGFALDGIHKFLGAYCTNLGLNWALCSLRCCGSLQEEKAASLLQSAALQHHHYRWPESGITSCCSLPYTRGNASSRKSRLRHTCVSSKRNQRTYVPFLLQSCFYPYGNPAKINCQKLTQMTKITLNHTTVPRLSQAFRLQSWALTQMKPWLLACTCI